jgi:molybdopterin-binding protein
MDFMQQSIRNEIPGTVKEIISDKVLSEIIVETRIGEMAAVITTRSVQDMGLKVGEQRRGPRQGHQRLPASPRFLKGSRCDKHRRGDSAVLLFGLFGRCRLDDIDR